MKLLAAIFMLALSSCEVMPDNAAVFTNTSKDWKYDGQSFMLGWNLEKP